MVQRFYCSTNLIVRILVLCTNSVQGGTKSRMHICIYLPTEVWRYDIACVQNRVQNRSNFCTLFACKTRVRAIKWVEQYKNTERLRVQYGAPRARVPLGTSAVRHTPRVEFGMIIVSRALTTVSKYHPRVCAYVILRSSQRIPANGGIS